MESHYCPYIEDEMWCDILTRFDRDILTLKVITFNHKWCQDILGKCCEWRKSFMDEKTSVIITFVHFCCKDDSNDLQHRYSDFDSVDYKPFVLEDELVSGCPETTQLDFNDFWWDYVNLVVYRI